MFMMTISLFFECGYLIILLNQSAQEIICNQANSGNICISMKWSLVCLELLDPNCEKMEIIYKTDNFNKDIAFGASLFVFCDLNTHFQL